MEVEGEVTADVPCRPFEKQTCISRAGMDKEYWSVNQEGEYAPRPPIISTAGFLPSLLAMMMAVNPPDLRSPCYPMDEAQLWEFLAPLESWSTCAISPALDENGSR